MFPFFFWFHRRWIGIGSLRLWAVLLIKLQSQYKTSGVEAHSSSSRSPCSSLRAQNICLCLGDWNRSQRLLVFSESSPDYLPATCTSYPYADIKPAWILYRPEEAHCLCRPVSEPSRRRLSKYQSINSLSTVLSTISPHSNMTTVRKMCKSTMISYYIYFCLGSAS